jgi:hypothetical protein
MRPTANFKSCNCDDALCVIAKLQVAHLIAFTPGWFAQDQRPMCSHGGSSELADRSRALSMQNLSWPTRSLMMH